MFVAVSRALGGVSRNTRRKKISASTRKAIYSSGDVFSYEEETRELAFDGKGAFTTRWS